MIDSLVKRLRWLGECIEHAHKEPRPRDAITIDDVDWGDVYEAADLIEVLEDANCELEWEIVDKTTRIEELEAALEAIRGQCPTPFSITFKIADRALKAAEALKHE